VGVHEFLRIKGLLEHGELAEHGDLMDDGAQEMPKEQIPIEIIHLQY
jgi:hypothetical protein